MGEKIQYSYIKPPSNSRGGGWGCLQNKQNRRRMTTYNCAPLRHPLLGDMLHGNLKSHRKEYNVSVNYRGHTSCFLTERTRELRNTPLSWRHMQDQNIAPPPPSIPYLPVCRQKDGCRRTQFRIRHFPVRIPLGKPSRKAPSPL